MLDSASSLSVVTKTPRSECFRCANVNDSRAEKKVFSRLENSVEISWLEKSVEIPPALVDSMPLSSDTVVGGMPWCITFPWEEKS